MSTVEVKVPNIGDFKDVEVIELMVKAGDTIKVDQSLVTVESDKASMEIPSTHAGVVQSITVKVGDKINEGTLLLTVEEGAASPAADAKPAESKPAESKPADAKPAAQIGAQAVAPTAAAGPTDSYAPAHPAPAAQLGAAPAPAASSYSGPVDIECDMMVLGAGPGGYSAAFRAADLGMNTVLVEKYATLGGVCLNVGCIPSKALLHVASVMDETAHMADLGVAFAKPEVDIDKLRGYKDGVIKKMTGGLAFMAKARKVNTVQGVGAFLSPNHIEVTAADGGKKVIAFKKAVIAAGSSVVKLPFVPEDPRIVDSTGALELRQVPKKMLVIGGGIIGLEMATVYSTLGARIDVVEMMDGLMQGADREAVKVWQKYNAHRFDNIMLKTKTVGVEALPEGIKVTFESAEAGTAAPEPQLYDLVLVAVGRSPNGKKVAADKAGVTVSDRGFIAVDSQMRTNVPHIFAIGDLVGQPMLAHKAVHEAHVAAEAAFEKKTHFDAKVIPSVAYTDPEVAWVGLTEDEAKQQGIKVEKGHFPWNASGRAVANGRDEGFTKLLFDAETHRIIGGTIVGTHAGDMIGEIALAIEMGADGVDIGKTIHPHPTLGESIGMAAEAYEGVCTDLPPPRKR
jgi:dihydrolipoamide dehydrogenase